MYRPRTENDGDEAAATMPNQVFFSLLFLFCLVLTNKSKQEGYVYVAERLIVSRDDANTTFDTRGRPDRPIRIGQLSMYVYQPIKIKNILQKRWIGVTATRIFAQSWMPNVGFDFSEDTTGSIAYEARWIDPKKRADLSSEQGGHAEIIRRVGQVVKQDGPVVYVLIDDEARPFSGTWVKTGSIPIQEEEKTPPKFIVTAL